MFACVGPSSFCSSLYSESNNDGIEEVAKTNIYCVYLCALLSVNSIMSL